MQNRLFKASALAALMVLYSCGNTIKEQAPNPKAVEPFDLTEVNLLDGPFKHSQDITVDYLLEFEPDRLLSRFRTEAGLEPKAKAYGGWEGESLAGHTLGHYLSACALMYESTEYEEFKDRANYIVSELAEIQKGTGGGYLGAFPNGQRVFEDEVAKGNITSHGFDLNGIWSPFYTHHKVLAGLRDVYRLLGNEQALEVEKNFADWIGTIVLPLTHKEAQEMMNTEFGGVQETLADLYTDTGEEKYLEIAKVFHHDVIIDPLAKGEDILPNKHGNTQIPKLIASTKMYDITGDENEKQAAEFFWTTVVNHHSYATGGHGNHEYFGQPDQLTFRLSNETTETCNVYNMLKLSRNLFSWEPRAEISDFYERAYFNHILSSIHPESAHVIYNLSLEMGGRKDYQNPMWFTCCVGSGMETHSKHAANIYYHNDNELYAAQYIASQLEWKEMGLTLTQSTQYPDEDSSNFSFKLEEAKKFNFYVRYPFWAENGIDIQINGESQKIDAEPGSYLAINRTWKDEDQVSVKIPFSLRLEAMPDDENRIAVFNGPVLLAGDLGEVRDERANDSDFVPIFMSEEREPAAWLQKMGEANSFQTQGIGQPRDVTFKPFYKTHDRRYSVYFDLFNQERWDAKQAAYEAEQERKKHLEAITFDAFQPGEMQPERNHNFKGDSLNMIRDFNGRNARGAERGGWLSFEMKVEPTEAMNLVIEYWGGYTGSKTFDILIDGKKIATENISGKQDGAFIDVPYEIPASLTQGKDKVTVKFAPHPGHRAGPFFYARTVKRE